MLKANNFALHIQYKAANITLIMNISTPLARLGTGKSKKSKKSNYLVAIRRGKKQLPQLLT
jgi:hypothetical protein